MRSISIISSRTFCTILWIDLICNVLWRLIYFSWSVCKSFRLFRVQMNYVIRSVQFRKFWNEMILRSTSEARIWFLTITLITLIIRVEFIKSRFLIDFFLFILLKALLSWVWISTVTAPWSRKTLFGCFLLNFPDSNN